MKRIVYCTLGAAVAALVSFSMVAADNSSPAPGAASPVVDTGAAGVHWLTSVPEAQELARKEKKLVFMDFTGSDWCGWCKKLDAETFSQPAFAEYARKNLVLVEVNFPNEKPQSASLKAANSALKDKYNIEGFPTLITTKPDGTVVWKQVGYLSGGPTAMIAKLDEAKTK